MALMALFVYGGLIRLSPPAVEVAPQWTTPIPTVTAGDVFTTPIGVAWDEYAQVAGLPGDWVFLMELELRKGGGGVVDSKQVISPGCEGALAPGTGWCGAPTIIFWDTDGLAPGPYEVFARLTWTNAATGEIVYGHVEGELSHGGDYFYIFEKFTVMGQTYLPIIMKRD